LKKTTSQFPFWKSVLSQRSINFFLEKRVVTTIHEDSEFLNFIWKSALTIH